VIISLSAIRTDGWFERVGERVGSFSALCEIVGEQFFAFSLITGARITALTVDRRNPGESLVDFEVGGDGEESDRQRLPLRRFRQRLVSALLTEENFGPQPTRATDVEAIQQHIGVRYLLLAPIFGYSLNELHLSADGSHLLLQRDGIEEAHELGEFRRNLRGYVIDELDRAASETEPRSSIDPAVIPEAEAASRAGEPTKVLELLGNWTVPLTLLLRTPSGQALNGETRAMLGGALGLLGQAALVCGEAQQAEDALRLSIQYCVDTPASGTAYARLGAALLRLERPGEAIAPLRRAANLGAAPELVWPPLGEAFLKRQRYLAAWGVVEEAVAVGLSDPRLNELRAALLLEVPLFERWVRQVRPGAEPLL
jgi:hypothetical protein